MRLSAFLLFCFSMAASAAPTNIVYLVIDDMGFPHSNVMERYLAQENGIGRDRLYHMPVDGVQLVTPNLDLMAQEGAFFPNAHVMAPYCNTSLRAVVDGMTVRHSATRTRQPFFEHLDQAGYVMAAAGKWWEDDAYTLGFDEVFDLGLVRKYPMTVLTDFIERRHVQDSSHPPFFLWAAPKLPHAPLNAYSQACADIYQPTGSSDWKYHAMICTLDEAIGELMTYLKTTPDPRNAGHPLIDNTLVVAFVDNGWKLPRSKGSFSENGMRTPMLIMAPDVLPRTIEEVALTIDLYPTALEYAEVDNADYAGYPDGVSLRPLLTYAQTEPNREIAFQEDPSSPAYTGILRRPGEHWRLNMKYDTGKTTRLCNLQVDPLCEDNLIKDPQYVDVIEEIRDPLYQWYLEQ